MEAASALVDLMWVAADMKKVAADVEKRAAASVFDYAMVPRPSQPRSSLSSFWRISAPFFQSFSL